MKLTAKPKSARKKIKKVSGRPPKFHEPRRPITVTIPDRTLAELDRIDSDRARAIVKAVEAIRYSAEENRCLPPVEIVEVCPGQALIVIGPSQELKKIPWLRLIEIAPMRYLLSVPTGTAVEALELAIRELVDKLSPGEDYERSLLSGIGIQISSVKRDQKLSKAEILFVATT